MKLRSIILEHNELDACRTGKPVQLLLYRGESGGNRDIARGVFYTPRRQEAEGYAREGHNAVARGRPGKVITRLVKLSNPLVVKSTTEAMRIFKAAGVIDAKTADKLIDVGLYGWPVGERALAKCARACGYDAIIYNGGLNEVVVF